MHHTSVGELVRAARRAGVRVVSVEAPTDGPPRATLECNDGWGAARLLVELGREDGARPTVRAAAKELRRGCRTDAQYIERVHAFVRNNVRFEPEEGEIFQGPAALLDAGVGDCDCQARLVAALLRGGGVSTRYAFLHVGGEPAHVVVQAWDGKAWRWVETSCAAEVGENPVDAATRLGILRPDIVQDGKVRVSIMGLQLAALELKQGAIYRMRAAVVDALPSPTPIQVVAAMTAIGFVAVRVWAALATLPAGWPEDQTQGDDGRTVWIEAAWPKADDVLSPEIGPLSIIACAYTRPMQTWGGIEGQESLPGDDTPTAPTDPAPPETVPSGPTIPFVPGVDPPFWPKLVAAARAVGADPRDWAAVMFSESGLRPTSAPRGKGGGIVAVGINEFSNVGRGNVIGAPGSTFDQVVRKPSGLEPEEYATLSASEQLDRFVAPFLQGLYHAHHLDPAAGVRDLYWLNFLPGTYVPGKDDDFDLLSSPALSDQQRRDFAAGNPALVTGGRIPAGNLRKLALRAQASDPKRWALVLAAIAAAEAGLPPGPEPVASGATLGKVLAVTLPIMAAGVGLAAWWAHRSA